MCAKCVPNVLFSEYNVQDNNMCTGCPECTDMHLAWCSLLSRRREDDSTEHVIFLRIDYEEI